MSKINELNEKLIVVLQEKIKLLEEQKEISKKIVKIQEEQLIIADVGNFALYNDMPLVYNMCLSYRHDFVLLNATEQEQLVFECKEWLRAYENNK